MDSNLNQNPMNYPNPGNQQPQNSSGLSVSQPHYPDNPGGENSMVGPGAQPAIPSVPTVIPAVSSSITSMPTSDPISTPTGEPMNVPTGEPMNVPTIEQIGEPMGPSTIEPTSESINVSAPELTDDPMDSPTIEPTSVPTSMPKNPSGSLSDQPEHDNADLSISQTPSSSIEPSSTLPTPSPHVQTPESVVGDLPTPFSEEQSSFTSSTTSASASTAPPVSQKTGVRGIAIDLLPEMSEKQVKTIQKKGKTNVFAVMLVFSVVATTVGILLLNLITKADVNHKKQRIAEENAKIVSLQYIELKQRTLMTKILAYEAVREFDFSSDVVLEYLLETASGLSDVRSMSLDENLEFSFSGTTDSYINVARLWHDMASQQDYFSTISLDGVSKTQNENGTVFVSFSFSGSMIKENVDKL